MKPQDMIGLVSGSDATFLARWATICRDAQVAEDAWIAKLRADGVKAAHPDDYWVDRKTNVLQLVYPHFNDGVKVGCTVALGSPTGYRLVKLTGYRRGSFSGEYFSFEPMEGV
ncbi:MAG: hypothetical protein AAFO57_00200 [Pseudomonadota bacterium]